MSLTLGKLEAWMPPCELQSEFDSFAPAWHWNTISNYNAPSLPCRIALSVLIDSMPSIRNHWSFLFWPIVGLMVSLSLSYLIIQQYEAVWRANQNTLATDELQFFCRVAEAGGKSAAELMALANQAGDGQLILLSDKASTSSGEGVVATPAVQWYVEPDGFRRVQAIRQIDLGEPQPHWIVFSKRLTPMNRDSYRWVQWLVPMGVVTGLLVAANRWRASRQLMRTMRSLQSLRSQPSTSMPREEMMELFPEANFYSEVNRELIALLESFQSKYADIQSGAEQSQSVLAAMPVGILAFTSKLRLAFANRAGIDMLELSEPVRVDSKLIELIRQPKVIDFMTESQRSRVTMDSELERPANQTVLRLRAYPLPQDPSVAAIEAKPPMLLIVTDETRLRQLENARRDFTANVSHELKTPLAAIKAYAETLLMGALEDPDAKERFVQRISEQAARLDNLIHDLLQLTKIQSLPEGLSLMSMPLTELVRTCVDEQVAIAATRNVTIDNQVAGHSMRVLADHEAMCTILSNLLSNAVRYSKPGGRVIVRAAVTSGMIALAVVDNGIGIPEADLDRIFERFYRVDKARSQDAGGTGLGLAIVKYLVQALGGTISVRSKLGEGSEFTVRLEQAVET